MVHIAVLMMVKNEKKRLSISLESIKDIASSLVIFDTGSTDNTIEICQEFCKKYDIPLRLKQGTFKNFSYSRNESLDFLDTFNDIDYALMLDCNDELRNGDILKQEAEKYLNDDKATSFLITQEWFSGTYSSYYNIRFLKPRKNWRYKGVVHEYIAVSNEKGEDIDINGTKLDPRVRLFQDRTQDDDKTGKRFHRDKDLLLEEYKRDPTNARTVFYLAQTYSCLDDVENAFYYYKRRIPLVGFWEEVFHAYLRCGDFSIKLKHDWYETFAWYMKAFEHIPRAEPLIKIAHYYHHHKKNNVLAFTFLDLACKLKFPDHCILFVDKMTYDYTRWHLMGIVGYYAKKYDGGKAACLKALEYASKNNMNTELDKKNLEFYLNAQNEIKNMLNNNSNNKKINDDEGHKIASAHENILETKQITRSEYLNLRLIELKRIHPTATEKKLIQLAKLEWKKREKNL